MKADELSLISHEAECLLGDRPVALHDIPTLDDINIGYAVQDAVWRRKGGQVAGYKIGLTGSAGQKALGATEPASGRVTAERILTSPARIQVDRDHLLAVEPEILFVLGRDLVVGAEIDHIQQVLAATASLHAGIEICNSRFLPGRRLTLAELVADNVNADWLVIGDAIRITRPGELEDISVSMDWAGDEAIVGSTAAVLGNPARAVARLARQLVARGEVLRKGMVIASGTCAGIVKMPPHVEVTARFGGAACARVTIDPGLRSCNSLTITTERPVLVEGSRVS